MEAGVEMNCSLRIRCVLGDKYSKKYKLGIWLWWCKPTQHLEVGDRRIRFKARPCLKTAKISMEERAVYKNAIMFLLRFMLDMCIKV